MPYSAKKIWINKDKKYLVDSLYQLDSPISNRDLCCSFIVKTGRKDASM